MKTIFGKVFFIVLTIIAVFVFCLPCSAKNDGGKGEETHSAEFQFTVPKAIAAGSAVLLFTVSQVILYKHTDRE